MQCLPTRDADEGFSADVPLAASGILTHATQAKAGFSIFWGIYRSPTRNANEGFSSNVSLAASGILPHATQEGQASPSFKDVPPSFA